MTHSARHLAARLAAAVLTTAAAGLGGLVMSAPASAATCGTGSGVSVVVDFGGLGGGVRTACVADGAGKTASSLFTSTGFNLSYVQNEPGFVCRIDNLPSPSVEACVNTPPDNAYWGLWWSDGTSGDWVYSNYGAGTLKVPDGSYVGFAWQSGSKSPPGAAATPHTSTPTPSATPTPSSPSTGGGGNGGGNGNGGGHGGNGNGGGHGSTSPSARPTPSSTVPTAGGTPTTSLSGSPSASPTKGGGGKHRTPSSTPTPSSVPAGTPSSVLTSPATDSAAPEERSEVAAGEGALPVWVVPLVILVLGASASAVYVKRRRNRPSP